jgi:hypothetical protein
MFDTRERQSMWSAQAVRELQNVKQHILDAMADDVPEPLLLATVVVAVLLARRQATPAAVLSERVCQLVSDSLQAPPEQPWNAKLILPRCPGEGGHGLS